MGIKKITPIFLSFLISSVSYAFDVSSIFGETTYKVYGCKGDRTQYTPAECSREQIGTATFKVIKEKSQVFISYTLLKDSKKVLIELESCRVIDSKNWICGGKETSTSENGLSSYMRESKYQMVDGQVDVTDFYATTTLSGYPPTAMYGKGYKFVKN